MRCVMEKVTNAIMTFAMRRKSARPRRRLAAAILAAGMLGPAGPSLANGDEVNVYSYRQEFLIRPLLDKFTAETGIAVNVQDGKGGILKRMQEEHDAFVGMEYLAG